jgi:hypothetical protein
MSFESRAQQNTILWDDSGNAVGVIIDGVIYRLQTQSTMVGKTAGAGANKEVSVVDDATSGTTKRLQVEADIKPGATIGIGNTALNEEVVEFLTDDVTPTGSRDMIVNGAGTPVTFTFPADATADIFLSSLRIVMVAGTITFDGSSFMKGTALSNGVLIEATINDHTNVVIANIMVNEEMLHLQGNPFTELGAINDIVVATIPFSGREKLAAGTSDEIKITIRDNFTSGAYAGVWFQATFNGFTEG